MFEVSSQLQLFTCQIAATSICYSCDFPYPLCRIVQPELDVAVVGGEDAHRRPRLDLEVDAAGLAWKLERYGGLVDTESPLFCPKSLHYYLHSDVCTEIIIFEEAYPNDIIQSGFLHI